MDFEALPGPSLPELARTALDRAETATITVPRGTVAVARVRAGGDGSPVLLASAGSLLDHQLIGRQGTVTVTVPAAVPFRAVRLTGTPRHVARDAAAGITACTVDLGAVELSGSSTTSVPVTAYRAAAPDPLWRIAPGVLHHLAHYHVRELVSCVRAHGMTEADWVMPRGLDRYGLELVVLTAGGAASARLSFPDGPVTSLQDVPPSIRIALTCRCQARPGPRCARPATS